MCLASGVCGDGLVCGTGCKCMQEESGTYETKFLGVAS